MWFRCSAFFRFCQNPGAAKHGRGFAASQIRCFATLPFLICDHKDFSLWAATFVMKFNCQYNNRLLDPMELNFQSASKACFSWITFTFDHLLVVPWEIFLNNYCSISWYEKDMQKYLFIASLTNVILLELCSLSSHKGVLPPTTPAPTWDVQILQEKSNQYLVKILFF